MKSIGATELTWYYGGQCLLCLYLEYSWYHFEVIEETLRKYVTTS